MTAAQKALDALEAAGKSGACPPWDAATLATNLAAPLAAVVRAAMAGYASGGFDRALDRNDEGDQWAHQLVAALDAFNAAAQEMFGKETT